MKKWKERGQSGYPKKLGMKLYICNPGMEAKEVSVVPDLYNTTCFKKKKKNQQHNHKNNKNT